MDNTNGKLNVTHEQFFNDANQLMNQHGFYTPVIQTALCQLSATDKDRYGFLTEFNNWSNHRGLLLLGLHLTSGQVLEMGSGDGSTPYIYKYCKDNKRLFFSFDNNKEWCNRTGAEYEKEWGKLIERMTTDHYGLVFIDHAPGERRHLDAITLANAADVLVLHDTEEGGAGNYMWEKAWPHFRFRLNYNRTGGAGATLVSNKINVNRFRGLSLGPYTFDND